MGLRKPISDFFMKRRAGFAGKHTISWQNSECMLSLCVDMLWLWLSFLICLILLSLAAFPKKTLEIKIVTPQNNWFRYRNELIYDSGEGPECTVSADINCAAASWLADHQYIRIIAELITVHKKRPVKWTSTLEPDQLVRFLISPTKMARIYTNYVYL